MPKPFTTVAIASAVADRALTWMAACHPPRGLLDLPTEILEDVVLHLCAQEILRLRIVMPLSLLWLRTLSIDWLITPIPR